MNSKVDLSLFVCQYEPLVSSYFLVYVDNLVITSNSSEFVNNTIACLGKRKTLKDMGNLHYFGIMKCYLPFLNYFFSS